MGVLRQHFHNTKQLSFQFQDQDSSLTQSTGQSDTDVASPGDSQGLFSAQSGCAKPLGIHTESATSMGTRDFVFPPSQSGYSQSSGCIQFYYPKPYFGGLLPATYAPESMQIHPPQMVGLPPARVPLPLDLTEDEPIYVNAKQYHGILRRRQYRAKLEAQNKLIKARKPYLHESRHLHALKRARGSGGRFLNSKKVQDSNPTPTRNPSDSKTHQLENYNNGSSTISCSSYPYSTGVR